MTSEQVGERPRREVERPASPGPGPAERPEDASAAAAQEARPEPPPRAQIRGLWLK